MISKDLRFEGFDAASWTKIVSLFAPDVVERIDAEPADSDAPEHSTLSGLEVASGTLLVVVDEEDNVLRATHTVSGRITGLPPVPSRAVEALAKTYAARRVVWIRRGALEELQERLALRLRQGDDYVSQWLVGLRVLRELGDAGTIRVWPNPVANVPVPSAQMVGRTVDVVLPNDHAAVAVLWKRGEPWASIAFRRRNGVIDSIVGPDLISRWTGPLGGDWRRDHRIVADAVSRHLAPVHVGLFSEEETVRELLRHPDPGRWALAATVRDVVFYPTPPYVAVALGADVARSAARQAATWLGGLGVFETLVPVAESLRARVTDFASVTATLGFNPLQALGAVLRGEDRSPNSNAPKPPPTSA